MSGSAFRAGDPAPRPLPSRSEADVMARWHGDEPVVSILCPTYQHVDFIEDALRGFLGQDTDFPFEVLVRDDASTDGTADIVRDYSERYPNVIRAVLETENRYPQVKAGQVLGPMVRGEFIASCEGDDYWIDPRYLQSCVGLLRQSPSLSIVAGRTVHTLGERVMRVRPHRSVSGPVSSSALAAIHNIAIHPSGRVFRSRDLEHTRGGHATRNSLLGTLGSGVVLREVVSVRRIHAGGIHSGLPPTRRQWAAVRSNRKLLRLHWAERRRLVAGILAARILTSAGVAVLSGLNKRLSTQAVAR